MYSIGLYIYQVDMYTLGLVVSVRRSFDASRGGKKELKSSRDKNARHEPYWGGGRGEKRLLCDPAGSELRLDGREKRRAKIINGIFFVFLEPRQSRLAPMNSRPTFLGQATWNWCGIIFAVFLIVRTYIRICDVIVLQGGFPASG